MAAEEAWADSSRCTRELRRSTKIKSGNGTHVHCFPKPGRFKGALVRDPKDGRAGELGSHSTETRAARARYIAFGQLESNVTDLGTPKPHTDLNFPQDYVVEDARLKHTPSQAGSLKLLREEAGFIKSLAEERDLGKLPSDYKDETDRDKGGEDHSPDERSSDVVPQSSLTSFEHGVYGTQLEDGAEGNGAAIVCVDNAGMPAPASPVVSVTPMSWIGKRRRTSGLCLPSSDEKGAIRGLLLLSKATAWSHAL